MRLADRIGRRLKLRDLNILLAVAQSGSMARAAKQLAVSQPVVSKAMSELEKTLGVRLFDRSRTGVEPTAYGRALLARGIAAFDELRQGVQDIESLNDPAAGEVRIAGTEAMVAGLLPIVVERLCRRYPRITVHVTQVYTTPDLYEGLRDRTVDFVIGRMLGRPIESDLQAEILFNEPTLVVAGASNVWTRRRKIELAELSNEPWILPRPNTAVGALIADTFQAAGLAVPRPTVIANSIHMNNVLLASGRFLTMHPRSLVALNIGPALKVLPVTSKPQHGPVGIVTLKKRTLNATTRLFIDCLRQIARPLARPVKY